MTTYSAIAAGEIDADSPVTDTLMGKLTNNLLALGEADASVPANLLPMVLLGTLTTTSGTTQTLSGLVLTPYRMLWITVNGVSFNSTVALSLNGLQISQVLANAGHLFHGSVMVDLTTSTITGILGSGTPGNGVAGVTYGAAGTYTTATTSISFTGGTFDAGSILVYGVK